MKFLVDVSASGAVARWLVEMGYDVVQVSGKDPGMRDHDILNWANREGRVIITTDKDFEEMIWRQGRMHSGVLRLENLPRADGRALLEDVLVHHGDDLESGAIVIALNKKIRIRKCYGSISKAGS